jgi:hypothetical protein
VEKLLRACTPFRSFSVSCIYLNLRWISDVSKNAHHFDAFRYTVEITVQNLPPDIQKYNCIDFVLCS